MNTDWLKAYQGLRETWPHVGALRDCGSCPEQCLKKKKLSQRQKKKKYIEWAGFGSCRDQCLPMFTVNKKLLQLKQQNTHSCLGQCLQNR
jgi:hypothetical protein